MDAKLMEIMPNWESKIIFFFVNKKGEHILLRLSRMSFDLTYFELKLPFHLYAFSLLQECMTDRNNRQW